MHIASKWIKYISMAFYMPLTGHFPSQDVLSRRSSFVWDVMQRRLVISTQHFGTTYWSQHITRKLPICMV